MCGSEVRQRPSFTQGAIGRVRMLSDSAGALTKALGQEKPSGVLTRSSRYSMVR